MDNYYDTLGVSEDSTPEEIKKNYKKLSKVHHPDRGGDEEKFKKISEAYNTLGDGQKKQRYDQKRSNPFGGSGMGDAFDNFFGGQQQRQRNVGQDLNANIRVTLEEIHEGVVKTIRFNRSVMDPTVPRTVCRQCGGSGRMSMGPFQTSCSVCHGKGVTGGLREIIQELEFNVPKGSNDKETIFYGGMGNSTGGESGNLFVKVVVQPHPIFKRDGSNLIIVKGVPFPSLILGGDIKVKTITGEIRVTIPKNSNPFDKLRVAGKGLNRGDGYGVGDLIVELKAVVPKVISDGEKGLLEKLAMSENFINIV